MRNCCAISGFSSMFTLTRRTLPLASVTARSSRGVSCLHGPHHGAQKSTMTGVSMDASSTSAANVASDESLISADVPAAGDGVALAGSLSFTLIGRPEGSMSDAMSGSLLQPQHGSSEAKSQGFRTAGGLLNPPIRRAITDALGARA